MSETSGPATSPPPTPGPRITAAAYLRLVLLGAAIGIPAALLAAGFLALVHEIEHLLWTDLPEQLGESSPPWYLVIGLPVVGALLVVVARRFLPGDGGHPPLDGLSAAPTALAHGPGVALAAIGTLAFGAVLGPEGPLIALGSVVGLAITPFVRLNARESAVVATAGSFAAVSALFGGPLVAGMLLLEAGVGLGAAAIPMLLPGLVAAAVGYLLFVGFGDWGGLDATALTVPGLPPYDGVHAGELFIALLVGVVTSLLLAAVRRLGHAVAALRSHGLTMPGLLLAGGLTVGLIAQFADVLGADSQDVLFSGQASIPALLNEESARIVLILLIAKALGYAVSLGCGFRGGPVFPAIFLGVGVATLAVVWFDISSTLALVIGTAAGMTAMTRLLFASILFAALLAGSQGVDAIPVGVLAAAAAWITTAALDRQLPPASTSQASAADHR